MRVGRIHLSWCLATRPRPRVGASISGLTPTQDDARYQGTVSVHYPFHPLFGQDDLPVLRRTGSGDVAYVEVQAHGTRQAFPVWMTDPDRCARMTCGLLPACDCACLLHLAQWLQALDLSQRS